ncbi:MAG: DMT family transporter [Anaerolineales bacterium]
MNLRLKAELLLLLTAVIWGTAFVAQRAAALQDSLFLFNAARFLLGALVLLPFCGLRWRAGWRQWGAACLAGALLFVAGTLQQLGMHYTTAGNAGFLTSLYVVLVPVLLLAFWCQRPAPAAWAAVWLAVAGAYLLGTNGQGFVFRAGDALELAGAVFWALHVIVVGKYAAGVATVPFAAAQFAVCALLSLLVGWPVEGREWRGLSAVLISIFYTGILSVGLGYTLQVWAQRHTPPTEAALILSLEAVTAVVAGWFFLQERLTFVQGAGCLLILMGVVIVQLKNVRM